MWRRATMVSRHAGGGVSSTVRRASTKGSQFSNTKFGSVGHPASALLLLAIVPSEFASLQASANGPAQSQPACATGSVPLSSPTGTGRLGWPEWIVLGLSTLRHLSAGTPPRTARDPRRLGPEAVSAAPTRGSRSDT